MVFRWGCMDAVSSGIWAGGPCLESYNYYGVPGLQTWVGYMGVWSPGWDM